MGLSIRSAVAALAVITTTITLQNAQANLIDTGLVQDGSFADDPLPNGWTLLQRGGYNWAANSPGNPNPGVMLSSYYKASDGTVSSVPSVLVQEIKGLTANTHYQLSMDSDWYGTGTGGGSIQVKLQIMASKAGLNDVYLYQAVRDYTTNGWSTTTLDFTTGSNQTAIQIRLRSAANSWEPEAYFDNIVLRQDAPVPEPAAMGLVILPLACTLFRRR